MSPVKGPTITPGNCVTATENGARNQEDHAKEALADPTVETLRLCFEQVDQSIAISDWSLPDQPLIYVNRAFLTLTGYSESEVLGRNCRFLQGNDRDQPVREAVKRNLLACQEGAYTFRNYRKDGSYFLNHVQMSFVKDALGNPKYSIAFQRDITNVSWAYTNTDTNWGHSKELATNSQVVILETAVTGGAVKSVSPSDDIIHGYTSEQWTKPDFWQKHIHQDDRDVAVNLHGTAVAEGRNHTFEYRFFTSDGRTVWLRHIAKIVRTSLEGPQVQSIIVDISDWKAEEKELREREVWGTTLLENAPDAFLTVDQNLRIQKFNAAAEKMFGWPRSFIQGKPLSFLIPEESRARHEDLATSYIEDQNFGARSMGEWMSLRGQRSDGSQFPAMIRLGKVRLGKRIEVAAITRDMSDVERKNKELNSLSHELTLQLERAERASEAKNQFLSTMSHELRTPLNAIIGFSELMHAETLGPMGSELYRGYAGDIKTSGEHLLSIINDILDLSRIESGHVEMEFQALSVRESVLNAIRAIRPVLQKAGLRVSTNIPKDLPRVRGDKRAVHQVLLNLLSNSAKFTPQGGHIAIRATLTGKKVSIAVEDNGRGIPAEMLPTLGTPFQKTGSALDSTNPGTGLGLAISRGIIKRMGGTTAIESHEGKWTRITVSIPAIRV